MRVSVFGLGYVGAVSCGCFCNDGMDVIGVDINPDKVALMNGGKSPVIEPRIGELIESAVRSGRLRATVDATEAVLKSDVSVISVGTPSNPNGSLSLAAVEKVSEEIGRALTGKRERHVVVVRSTMLPGSVRSSVVPALERASGKKLGSGFGIAYNPEFLREGRSVQDHYAPPFVLVGAWQAQDGEAATSLYSKVEADQYVTTVEAAEMVKYVCNAFHALKITFANEVGMLAQACGLDGRDVMALVCKDTKLNVSARYLQPGFAFGGSCLPKDVRALLYRGRDTDTELPLLQAILPSNRHQIERVVDMVLALKRRRIGMLGLSFKPGTDDLRESPLVNVAEALLGKGLDVRIYDKNVSLARLVGANKMYIEHEIPHLATLLVDRVESLVSHADVLVLGHGGHVGRELVGRCRPGQVIVDLAGVPELANSKDIDYRGVAW